MASVRGYDKAEGVKGKQAPTTPPPLPLINPSKDAVGYEPDVRYYGNRVVFPVDILIW